MNAEPQSIAILGGGISGLASAWHLRERARALGKPLTITLFEAAPRLGGVIRTSVENDCVLEHGPDSIIRIKPAGLALIRALGLESQIQDTRAEARHSFIARGNRLLPVPEGLYLLAPGRIWPFVRSPLISWPGKLRMLADLVIPRRDPKLGEESLAAFVRRRLGHEALERIAQPMVGGIYTADPEQLSLAATMPQFLDLERDYRSLILGLRARSKQQQAAASAAGPRYGLFMSLQGGLETLITTLVERLQQPDPLVQVRLVTGQRIDHAVQRDGGYDLLESVDGGAQQIHHADQLVVALPAHAAHHVLRTVDLVLASRLATVPYAGVATVNLAFPESAIPPVPEAAGFVVPAIEKRTVIACTFAHRKYADRAPQGTALLRAFVGGALHESVLDQDDATIIAAVRRDLQALTGIAAEPLFAHVHRWPKAMAQHVIGHRDMLSFLRAREATIPGLALVGNGYEGVGIPDLIAQAERAANRLIDR
jgi:oxygen-dependent protoporphyrinogen oxidase